MNCMLAMGSGLRLYRPGISFGSVAPLASPKVGLDHTIHCAFLRFGGTFLRFGQSCMENTQQVLSMIVSFNKFLHDLVPIGGARHLIFRGSVGRRRWEASASRI